MNIRLIGTEEELDKWRIFFATAPGLRVVVGPTNYYPMRSSRLFRGYWALEIK